MDIAPIVINDTSSITAEVNCSMPTFGSQTFTFFKRNKDWFLKYESYPIVKASVGADLFKGLNTQYEIYILPTKTGDKEVNGNNITSFYIGMQQK